MAARLYPALQSAPAVIPPPSLGWFMPLAESRRSLPGESGRAVSSSSSGMPNWPSIQPAVDNANVRWFATFSLPVRYQRPRGYDSALAASGMPLWPLIQPAVDSANNVRWLTPFAEPRRSPRDPRYTAAFAAGEAPRSISAFVVDNANVRWVGRYPEFLLRTITRLTADQIWTSQVAPSEVITADKWFRPLSDPTRSPVSNATRVASGMPSWPLNQPATDAATTTRWFVQFSIPERKKDPRALVAETAWLVSAGIGPIIQIPRRWWFMPLSIPQRFRRDLRYTSILNDQSGYFPQPGSFASGTGPLLVETFMTRPPTFWKGRPITSAPVAVTPSQPAIIMEDGQSYLLLESGFRILLE